LKVLLVDDEQELVGTLAERLRIRGIDSEWTTTGAKALQLAQKKHFDIAVLDIKMPKLGGLELKRRLHEIRPRMKFIFLTGHGSRSDFEEGAAEAGPEFYLVKPVPLETLIERLQKVYRNDL
jgi:DNA-binding response OmpR family regulator